MTPARRLALAIGVPVILGVVGATGFSIVAAIGQATFPVHYTFPAGARRLSVSDDGGDVVLRQVAGDQGSLAGTGTYSLVRPRISEQYSGGVASFWYHCRSPQGNCGLEATINVPAGVPASVNTDGGNVTASGMTGQVSLSSGGGDLTVSQVSGTVSLNTDGGNIEATGVAAAQVTAESGGGDIEIVFTKVPKDVKVNTDGGNITIVVPPGPTHYDFTGHTDGGNVTEHVLINSTSPNQITATSGGGDITITTAT